MQHHIRRKNNKNTLLLKTFLNKCVSLRNIFIYLPSRMKVCATHKLSKTLFLGSRTMDSLQTLCTQTIY